MHLEKEVFIETEFRYDFKYQVQNTPPKEISIRVMYNIVYWYTIK